jgi:ribonucleoside-diphosphate reductase alpha chain
MLEKPRVSATARTTIAGLPRVRRGQTTQFTVGDQHGSMTTGQASDGTIGEVTLRLAKQGSTLAGATDALGTAISLGLQAGAPLHAYTDDYTATRFAPAGPTDDPEIPEATSIVDYLARRLTLDATPPATP